MRDTTDDGLARAEARQLAAKQAAKRRADTLAEYASIGDDRRARSDELRNLRMLKEARERVAAREAAAAKAALPPKAKRKARQA